MTERVDHARVAQAILDQLDGSTTDADTMGATIAAAQVYATLALVEQQRMANVIAYWQLHTPRSTEENGFIEVSVLHGEGDDIDTIVREGLGL